MKHPFLWFAQSVDNALAAIVSSRIVSFVIVLLMLLLLVSAITDSQPVVADDSGRIPVQVDITDPGPGLLAFECPPNTECHILLYEGSAVFILTANGKNLIEVNGHDSIRVGNVPNE